MASRPYFVADRGSWYVKWKAGPGRWKAQRLCRHPGWSKGHRPPKKPPAEAVRLARVWEEREARAIQGLAADPGRPLDLRTFFDSYILTAEAAQTDGSLAILRRVAGLFVDYCASRGIGTVDGVTVQVCREYMAARAKAKGRKGEGLAYKTLKTERGTLAPAWSQAFQDGRVESNPWERVPVPGKPRVERPPFWTTEELQRIVAVCKPWLADVVLVGANTGIRITALLGLEWKDIDFDRGEVRVRVEMDKAAKGYQVPMSAKANEVLARRWLARADKNPLVFPGPKLGKVVPSCRVYEAIGRAVRRSGVRDFGRYAHSLRHSFATHAAMRGVPLKVLATWLGHSSVAMVERYTHITTEDTHRYMAQFDAGTDGGGQSAPPGP